MLGVTTSHQLGKTDEILREVAEEMGRGNTFYRTQVGVFFGESGVTVKDPYFGGEGPDRAGCTHCGGCMVGCRHNAKNTLDKNYLFFAEKRGAEIIPERRALDVRPLPGGGYAVRTERSTAVFAKRRRTFTAPNVVFAAGVLGTVNLLLRCRDRGHLPALSPTLGHYSRTNSEAIVSVKAKSSKVDYSEGIAVSAGFYPDPETHIEAVRYGRGSDFMALTATMMVEGGGRVPRPLRFIGNIFRHPIRFLRMLNPFGWAKRTMILLCMQPLDNRMNLRMRRRWWWPFRRVLDSDRGTRKPVPTYLPIAHETARRIAKRIDGMPQSILAEVLLDLSSTAHILGGCTIGHGPEDGVVDERCRVFGYEGLYVMDGSAIPANLGVNPSLTITALAEHAVSHIPPKGLATTTT
jgi:cholesterol oxidase